MTTTIAPAQPTRDLKRLSPAPTMQRARSGWLKEQLL